MFDAEQVFDFAFDGLDVRTVVGESTPIEVIGDPLEQTLSMPTFGQPTRAVRRTWAMDRVTSEFLL